MNGTEKKILLVEDEPIAQTVYQNRLKREGFEISFAEDGEIALNFLSRTQPDLVVLDLMLPKVNGVEVLKHIRSESRLKNTPVLVISNAYTTDLSQKAMESGATRGMLKTECTPAKLVEAVRDMLGFTSAFELSAKPLSDEMQVEAFVAAAEEALADEMILKETRLDFIQKSPAEVGRIREYCLAYVKGGATPAAIEALNQLYKQVRFFATRAGLSGCSRIALLMNAFEALLFEVVFKPAKATPSVSQTIAQAVDCLERLCQEQNPDVSEVIPKARILVVDDDPVCNYAMVAALKRAHFQPESVDDPLKALEKLQDGPFDVVFLDINMPVMNGFQVCEKLRHMPEYKNTPVIFITSYGDFQNRAQSILSGGNDLIPKPVSPVELVLKTTMRIVQPQGLKSSKAVLSPARPAVAAVPFGKAPIPFTPPPPIAPPPIEMEKDVVNGAPAAVDTISLDVLEKLVEEPNGKELETLKLSVAPESNNHPAPEVPLETLNGASSAPVEMVQPRIQEKPAPMLKLAAEPESRIDLPAPEIAVPAAPPELKLHMAPAPEEVPPAPPVEEKTAPLPPPKAEALPVPPPAPPAPAPAPARPAAPHPLAPHPLLPKGFTPPPAQRPPTAPSALPRPAHKPEQSTVIPLFQKAPLPLPLPPKPQAAPPAPPQVVVPPEVPQAVVPPATPEPIVLPEPPQAVVPPEPEKIPEPPSVGAESGTIIALDDERRQQNNLVRDQSTTTMETKTKPTFDEAARGVARIIFGDENISDMNVRLTRIALERYNVPGTRSIGEVARGVAQIIFGDENLSDMNVRLTRIALESYNISDVLGGGQNGSANGGTNGATNGHAATV